MHRIGDYVVHRLIGEGGMGKVYEAEERLSKRKVALKVLAPELARSEDARAMFLNEMTILAQLDHPNIVRSLASTEVDGDLVMVLELLEGQTLRQYLTEHGPMPWSEAVTVTTQIASALSAAHRQEPAIIHRDLKPENLMVLESGRVKVMDFGIAKVLQAISSSTTHTVGTLQYMSPEQIDAAPVDARSDLYSLGLVMYEMLAGRPPFESPSPRQLLDLQCTAEPPPLPDEARTGLPRGVEKVLLRLLEKAPDARPQSADALLDALEPFGTADDTLALGARSSGTSEARAEAGTADKPDAAKSAAKSAAKPAKPAAKPAKPAAKSSAKAPSRSPAMDTGRPAAGPMDTVGLVERAAEPREIQTSTALVVLIILCVLAGVATYLWKVRGADNSSPAPAASGAAAEPGAPTATERPPTTPETRR